MNKCEKCGFLHYRTDPCRPSKGTSTNIKVAGENRDLITRPTPRNAGENPEVPAIPKPEQVLQLHRPEPASKRPVGRPKTITDMAAYKADKQRQYRARKKASAEGRDE